MYTPIPYRVMTMNALSFVCLILSGWISVNACDLCPHEVAVEIAQRVWKNECQGTIEGLTYWKPGEQWASMGIGHCIWYPRGSHGRFEESFIKLLHFLEASGVTLPESLQGYPPCFWSSREEFCADFNSERMLALRRFLFETRDLQAMFMVQRLQASLPTMLAACCSSAERERVDRNFYRMSMDRQGLFALIDYLNFKGSGLSSTERYAGQGWGLLQVLQQMESTDCALVDFISTAKRLLQNRVEHAPKERNEQQWLIGWMHRLDSYAVSP